MPTMNEISVCFDTSPAWPALDAGRWNGWIVPRVTVEIRDEIAAWTDAHRVIGEGDTGAEIRECAPDGDGLVTLDIGLCFWNHATLESIAFGED